MRPICAPPRRHTHQAKVSRKLPASKPSKAKATKPLESNSALLNKSEATGAKAVKQTDKAAARRPPAKTRGAKGRVARKQEPKSPEPVHAAAHDEAPATPDTVVRPTKAPATPETQAEAKTPETVQRARTPETVQRARTPETVQRAKTPETVQRTKTPETVQRAKTPETVQRKTAATPEAAQHAGTPETVQRVAPSSENTAAEAEVEVLTPTAPAAPCTPDTVTRKAAWNAKPAPAASPAIVQKQAALLTPTNASSNMRSPATSVRKRAGMLETKLKSGGADSGSPGRPAPIKLPTRFGGRDKGAKRPSVSGLVHTFEQRAAELSPSSSPVHSPSRCSPGTGSRLKKTESDRPVRSRLVDTTPAADLSAKKTHASAPKRNSEPLSCSGKRRKTSVEEQPARKSDHYVDNKKSASRMSLAPVHSTWMRMNGCASE